MKIKKVTRLASGLYEVESYDGVKRQYKQMPEDMEIVEGETTNITSTDTGRGEEND